MSSWVCELRLRYILRTEPDSIHDFNIRRRRHTCSKSWYQWLAALAANVLGRLGNPEIDFARQRLHTGPLAICSSTTQFSANLKNEITSGEDFIAVDGKKIKVTSSATPPSWIGLQSEAQVVVESTVLLHRRAKAKGLTSRRDRQEGHHLCPGNKRDITIVLGVNQNKYRHASTNIISNAKLHHQLPRAVVKVILETTGLVSAS